jgi:hypothetical protein
MILEAVRYNITSDFFSGAGALLEAISDQECWNL